MYVKNKYDNDINEFKCYYILIIKPIEITESEPNCIVTLINNNHVIYKYILPWKCSELTIVEPNKLDCDIIIVLISNHFLWLSFKRRITIKNEPTFSYCILIFRS